jgi:flagellin
MANSLSIVTNSGAMRSNSSVMRSSRAVQKSVARMSSGLRVRSASDDAAALATSENLRAQRRGAQQAMRNANDGISILNTTEATFQSVTEGLIRMRELAVQASSDGITDTERAYLNEEFDALNTENERMANVAQFNDIQLTDGTVPGLTFQVGYRNSGADSIDVELYDLHQHEIGTTGLEINTRGDANAAISAIDAAMDIVHESRSGIGSAIGRLENAVNSLAIADSALGNAVGNARDADIGAESTEFAREQVLQQAGIAMIAQSNSIAQNALRLLS